MFVGFKRWLLGTLLSAGTLCAAELPDALTWWEAIYTPARAAVMRGTNSVMPFYAYYGQRLPASINKGGKLAASVYGSGVSWTHVGAEEDIIFLANMDYQRTDYRFSGTPENLLAGAAFKHVDMLRIFNWTEYVYDKANGRAIAGMISGSLLSSDSTSLSSGTHGAFALGYKQYFSRTRSVWLGASVFYSRHRERWSAMPAILLDFALSPDLNLRIGNGAEITWDVDAKNEWLLSAGISYGFDAITVGRGEVWYAQSIPLSLSVRRNIGKNFFVTAGAKTFLWTDYRLWEGGHESDFHFSISPSVELSLQAGVRF